MNPNGTRAATCEVLRMMEEGMLSADNVARTALSFLSEADVAEMARMNEWFEDEDEDEDED